MATSLRDRPPVILLVDDEKLFLSALRRNLSGQGYVVHTAENGEQGLALLETEPVDVAIVDLNMPGLNGHEVIREIRAASPATECVLLTGNGTLEAAEDAYRAGASDYFEKPILDFQRFHQILRKCLEVRDLRAQTDRMAAELHQRDHFENLIGRSRVMQQLVARIRDYAPHDQISVLITGESGTGKERVARALHAASDRSRGPFLAINCAAIPANLLESELFGHERSAFTGADRRRIGMFEKATNGTLLLDEIGDMPHEMQAKLLRVIQQREVTRIGGTEPIKISTRVVSATHRNLRKMVEDGTFRNDLLYRLNGLELAVPPLREREGDIRLLAYHFARAYAAQQGMTVTGIHHDAVAALQAHDWSENNVRELETAIQRAMVHMQRGEEVLQLHHLQFAGRPASPRQVFQDHGVALPEGFEPDWFELDYGEARKLASDWFRHVYVLERLKKTGYNVTRAAEMSGVARANFRKMMKASGVSRPKDVKDRRSDDDPEDEN
jgi:DNA-binding NtrC family response regulator